MPTPLSGQSTVEKSVNLLDIAKYLFFYKKWYVLSLLIFSLYFYYQYSKSSYVYQQSMSVIISNPLNTELSMRMSRFSWVSPVNVSNEILQFRSKELMREVVRRLDANISYTVRQGFRNNELYTQSPIKMVFFDDSDSYISMIVTPLNETRAVVTIWPGTDKEKKFTAPYNKKVSFDGLYAMIAPQQGNIDKQHYGTNIHVQRLSVEGVAAMFLGGLSISQTTEQAQILSFVLQDASPYRAKDVLTELVDAYNQQAINNKNKVALNTASFIKERLDIIEGELRELETQLERRKVAGGGEDFATAGQRYVSQGYSYDEQSKQIGTQIRLIRMMKDYLLDPSKSNELMPSNIGIEDASVVSQINLYNNMMLKRNRLMSDGGNNPVVAEMNNSLSEIRNNILQAISNAEVNLTIQQNDANVERQLARERASQVPVEQRVLLSIERQRKVKENLYIFLLNKQEDNALSRISAESNIQVIDPAMGSMSPIAPKLFTKMLMGVALGLFFPTGILLLILMLDTLVRTRKEIEDAIDVPFLAEIPYSKKAQEKGSTVAVNAHGYDAVSESFRILRTNLSFMSVDATTPQKVITFSSFTAGAGKTFTAVNMAASLKQIDKKVILVDLDLRKGTLSTNLNCQGGVGVTHYLSDHTIAVEDIILRDKPIEGVDLVPIGVLAPNPVELLLSKRLDQLIAELKKQYDYIIVDNVPLGIVADSSIINRISDITIFVVRSGQLDRRQLPELQKIYDEKKFTNMAILLNGIRPTGHSYGYGYGGYGYGYGYGSYGMEKKRWWQFWK